MICSMSTVSNARPALNPYRKTDSPLPASTLTLKGESLKVSSFRFDHKTADGDQFSLSVDSVKYKSYSKKVSLGESGVDLKEFVKHVKNEMLELKRELLQSIFGKQDRARGESSRNVETIISTEELEALIPEYWNAENTSQRIVDFALSFVELYQEDTTEYIEKVKSAIELGFKDAKEMLGNLPESVSDLMNSTYDLVMSKLDAWASEKGES
ncbi:hypothetical protein CHISP_3524 [Chitinispirillum alkaliphilum]|nr:hypothetical protein CHISP_3524 [Chitinispirillum alkaliphilum]